MIQCYGNLGWTYRKVWQIFNKCYLTFITTFPRHQALTLADIFFVYISSKNTEIIPMITFFNQNNQLMVKYFGNNYNDLR